MNDKDKENNGAIPSIDDERGDVSLKGVKGKRNSNGALSTILIFIGIIIFILSVAGYFLWGALHKNKTSDDGKPADPTLIKSSNSDNGNRGVDKLMATIAERKKAEQEAADKARKDEENKRLADEEAKRKQLMQQLAEKGRLDDNRQGQQSGRGSTEKIITPEQRKLQGKGLIYAGKDNKSKDLAQNGSQEAGGGLNDALQGGTYADGKASILKNRNYLLGMGTVLPCVLKTKIVTTYQALPICQLTKNIYSNDGNTLLLEAGTTFFGEMQKALLQGQARVFVNWTTAETPKGVRVRIDALGVDGLGAAGIPAWVDLHFWQRFGNAIMLSFIDDALATASNSISNSSSSDSIKVDNTEDAAKDMANTALENSINIPPTGYVNQGELISIIVPRDTYFNNVYEIH